MIQKSIVHIWTQTDYLQTPQKDKGAEIFIKLKQEHTTQMTVPTRAYSNTYTVESEAIKTPVMKVTEHKKRKKTTPGGKTVLSTDSLIIIQVLKHQNVKDLDSLRDRADL